MLKILFPIICGLIWCFRGYKYPSFIRGYLRAYLSAFMIIGLYCLWFTNMSVFALNPALAVICLTALESLLGYGESCENIDRTYIEEQIGLKNSIFKTKSKEDYAYLGFISMSYYLFPFMILNPNKPVWVYLLIAVLGYRIFPMNKLAQLKVFNKLAMKYKLDAWKIVEFGIGSAFVLWLIK